MYKMMYFDQMRSTFTRLRHHHAFHVGTVPCARLGDLHTPIAKPIRIMPCKMHAVCSSKSDFEALSTARFSVGQFSCSWTQSELSLGTQA